MINNQPYHIVTNSPWPIFMSINLMNTLISILIMFNSKIISIMLINFFLSTLIAMMWWRDIYRESTFQGFHTKFVINGLKIGMILFIVSECLFFLSFFWTYFHMFLSPNIEIGSIWPPKNIHLVNPLSIPFLNSIILLSSGISITWSHNSMINNNMKNSIFTLMITIFLGMIFTLLQIFEYYEIFYTMSDSAFGSIFYMTTGFHGIHVIIGSLFLLFILIRMLFNHLSSTHHVGFEAAAWYWHFVDVVWMFLFICLYWLPY